MLFIPFHIHLLLFKLNKNEQNLRQLNNLAFQNVFIYIYIIDGEKDKIQIEEDIIDNNNQNENTFKQHKFHLLFK